MASADMSLTWAWEGDPLYQYLELHISPAGELNSSNKTSLSGEKTEYHENFMFPIHTLKVFENFDDFIG